MRTTLVGAAVLGLLLGGCAPATSGPFTDGHHVDAVAVAAGVGQVRTYYIAADEVLWDYAPHNRDDIKGKPFDDDENVFVSNGPTRIGHVYRKSLYRGYTDASFTKRIVAPTSCPAGVMPCDDTLGMMGPVIRAVVGDTIKVVFKNNTQYAASGPPARRVLREERRGSAVRGRHEGAGQGRRRRGSGSHLHLQLEGSGPRWAGPDGRVLGDVDVPLAHRRDRRHQRGPDGPHGHHRAGQGEPAPPPPPVTSTARSSPTSRSRTRTRACTSTRTSQELAQAPHQVAADDEDAFEESNLMHSVNGFVYGNGPVLVMEVGQRVRWYTYTLGTEVDLHTPHWHGNTVTTNGMRSDMIQLLPGMMMVSDMVPDDPGTWLFHCHVNDHIAAGMLARYKVTP